MVRRRFAYDVQLCVEPRPVIAVVDGHAYETSVWRDKVHGCLLPVPAKIRGAKAAGDPVEVQLRPRAEAPG